MAAGRVSADKWVRLSAWIARHLPDLDAPKNKNATDPAYPGAGLVAHLLWGSGPTKRQALRAKAFADSAVARIKASDERETMTEINEQRTKWLSASWAIKARIEGLSDEARSIGGNEVRTTPTEFEIRDENDGMTISGYAAVFNSESEPLPFIERIAPGAFTRSLKSRNEIKLLWNHDSGEPMASMRGGSLRLWEDDKGLAYEAKLANTTRGRDVAELIRSKVIDAMSFGFNVIKDTWDERGNRTLESVRIHEISVVSYPAYTATSGTVQVRSAEGGIDAEALADALLRLESGEELESNHAQLIKDVVSKLEKTPEVEEVSGSILDLKQKQLDLLMKRV